MKTGKTALMELKNNWKGFLLFLLVIILLISGFTQAYPSFEDAIEDDLEGSDNIEVEVVEEEDSVTVKLSWKEIQGAENYTLLVSKGPRIIVPLDRVEGIESEFYNYTLPLDDEGGVPERYFTVVAVKEDVEEDRGGELVGMQTNFERTSALEEIWGIDYGDIQGFISMLWSMWWILLIGLYIGYVSVNSITKDYEEGRTDIILSNPISRKQYLLEKFSVAALYTLFLLLVGGLVLIGSVYSVGELGAVSSSELLLSSLLSWPLFLVIIGVSLLAAVYLENSKKAVGVSFVFILIQYGVHMVSELSGALQSIKPYTIISYWDFEEALRGEALNMFDLVLMTAVAVLLLLATVMIFERRDIPA